MARAGGVCAGLAFACALALFEGKVPVTKVKRKASAGAESLSAPLVGSTQVEAGKGPARISLEEVGEHRTEDDCWIVVCGRVLDVSDFLPRHPGGKRLLLQYAGAVADEGFLQSHGLEVLDELPRNSLRGILDDPSAPLQPLDLNTAAASAAAAVKTDPNGKFLNGSKQRLVLGARFE